MRIEIQNSKSINLINDVIHDQWFNIHDIKLDDLNEIITIKFNYEDRINSRIIYKFLILKKVKIPIRKYYLKINNVKLVELDDTEKVELYDFNAINFQEEESRIKITTGIPLRFELVVDKFKISIEDSDDSIKWKEKIVWF
ncbi:MAG: hypothetical protein HND52_05635 [Ignavibacteriae bacterium]|nr:hypothetical protein [Ignavibacteriota bacterium]NOG97433.1 hypothetical protein [Ignavibacteriota bacterium]